MAVIRAGEHRTARTETFKIIKRHLAAEALDCDDPVFEIPR